MFKKARSVSLLLLAIMIGICTFATTGDFALAETNPRIQLLESFLGDDRGIVYTLTDLRKGDTVYAYMAGTSGNLDPMLGVFKQEGEPQFQYNDVFEFIANSDVNIVDAFSQLARGKFVVWDDDGGQGYDARLKFTVPAASCHIFQSAGQPLVRKPECVYRTIRQGNIS